MNHNIEQTETLDYNTPYTHILKIHNSLSQPELIVFITCLTIQSILWFCVSQAPPSIYDKQPHCHPSPPDNCAFFIVTTQAVGAQIYELVASSPAERKV